MKDKWLSVPITFFVAIFMLISSTSGLRAEDYVVKHKSKEMGEVKSDKALVYILRPSFVGFAVKMWAFADDQFLGVTYGKNYSYAYVNPGEHVFWSKAENVNAIRMKVTAGQIYYLRQRTRPGAFRAATLVQVLTNKKEIKKAFKKSKYVTPTEAARSKASKYIKDHLDYVNETTASYPEVDKGETPPLNESTSESADS